MKPLLFALLVIFAWSGLCAQQATWQPSPGHTQIPIWPDAVPDPQPIAAPEVSVSEYALSISHDSPWPVIKLDERKKQRCAAVVLSRI